MAWIEFQLSAWRWSTSHKDILISSPRSYIFNKLNHFWTPVSPSTSSSFSDRNVSIFIPPVLSYTSSIFPGQYQRWQKMYFIVRHSESEYNCCIVLSQFWVLFSVTRWCFLCYRANAAAGFVYICCVLMSWSSPNSYAYAPWLTSGFLRERFLRAPPNVFFMTGYRVPIVWYQFFTLVAATSKTGTPYSQ